MTFCPFVQIFWKFCEWPALFDSESLIKWCTSSDECRERKLMGTFRDGGTTFLSFSFVTEIVKEIFMKIAKYSRRSILFKNQKFPSVLGSIRRKQVSLPYTSFTFFWDYFWKRNGRIEIEKPPYTTETISIKIDQ